MGLAAPLHVRLEPVRDSIRAAISPASGAPSPRSTWTSERPSSEKRLEERVDDRPEVRPRRERAAVEHREEVALGRRDPVDRRVARGAVTTRRRRAASIASRIAASLASTSQFGLELEGGDEALRHRSPSRRRARPSSTQPRRSRRRA